jgi:RNA polymerase sigma-70 factor, ECF subfamily
METPVSLLERLCRRPDPGSWQRFVSLYAPLVYRWGHRVGLQDQDAADLVQDVFTTLVQVLPTFAYDRRRGFRRWLRTVTLNRWRDTRKRPEMRALPEDLPAEASDAFWEVEYRQELARRAMKLMQTDFQPTTWRAFWEHTVVGRSASDVAAELGITVGAVYAAKFRVLQRLREELDGLLD